MERCLLNCSMLILLTIQNLYPMKKILLLSILLTITCGITVAQKRYVISPSHTLTGTAEFGVYTNFKIYQDNVSQDTLILKWKLLSDDLVTGWDYSSCAFGTCYAFIPDSLCTMNPIPPGEIAFLSLTLDPQNIKGTGKATLYLYDAQNPSVKDTITFIINAQEANGIHDYSLSDALKIYPNPATETLNVEIEQAYSDKASIQIFNLLGKSVYSSTLNSTDRNRINIQSLPSGIYFVRVDNGNGVATKKFEVIE